jgi:NAD(P)-dependent dehydrogenase (short-subunit alcohol dehydrogenase family)
VIITGAGSGIGRVMAKQFAAAGASVVIVDRMGESAATVAREIGAGDAVIATKQDVTVAADVDAMVSVAEEAFGRVDVLVNNAGGAPPADSATVSPRFNERIVALNLLAPINFAQAVHDTMQAQETGGVILNIASVSGTRPNPMGVAYGAAKAGLINASETLAAEWGPKIRVLTLTAGLIITEDAHLYYGDEEGVQRVGNTILARRMGHPDDIADVCLFLASPMARWMTGTNVMVHGGGEMPSYLAASTGEVTKVGS